MHGPFSTTSQLLRPYTQETPILIDGPATTLVVSEEFALTNRLVVAVTLVAAVAIVNGTTARLETAYAKDLDGNWLWDSASIQAGMVDSAGDTGATTIKVALGDNNTDRYPLGLVGRIVVDKADDDEIVIFNIVVSQPSR